MLKIRSKSPEFALKTLKEMLNLVVDRIYLQQLEYKMERDDIPDDYNFFEIRYCCHPALPYTHIQLQQVTKFVTSHFWEEDPPFIYDTFNNKKT